VIIRLLDFKGNLTSARSARVERDEVIPENKRGAITPYRGWCQEVKSC